MAGFRSKRLVTNRHADPITIDHIIDLKKRLRETERQLNNAIDQCTQLNKLVWSLRQQIMFPEGNTNDKEEDRNC